ncbi:endo-polygalacturonase [Moniliophthora roreri MCA 2997]|uniref:endo-polygalacturonase n=1 Tax=Moniliophthora roreri (strain MCA 2997) TaxID=1381753 RepID=V2YNL6_MONRO|nr:endo-polygalacturonase [Moniliophthora roreri MCA 2997]
MFSNIGLVVAVAFAGLAAASPVFPRVPCTGTIASLNDVAAAVKCTTIKIKSFTVPAGKTLRLPLLQGTTVEMDGDITFGVANWEGPLFSVNGKDITFNGNGHTFNGDGPKYWDGKGLSGVTRPDPMMRIEISGVYKGVKVVNSPARAYSVANAGPLLMTSLTVDNSEGDAPNPKSGGKAAGHNTDGFLCTASDLIISDSTVHNQDDCMAIGNGSNITFTRNTCTGLGHGIAIGSILSGAAVSDIHITNNKIIDSDQALRIKTMVNANSASVSGVTFSGNTATGCKRFGVIIDQGYPATLGKPGNGVKISDISFSGEVSSISVGDGANAVAVNCGPGTCTGNWDWSRLKITGGKGNIIRGFNKIVGFSGPGH